MSAPDNSMDIAIVGLACRFPGARDAAEFWRNLAAGVESITPLSDEDIIQSGALEAHLTAPHYVKAGPVLDEPGGFDAAFFGFTPNEARTMDPQHRILLELASAALEDAGCDSLRFPGRAGVFTGSAMNTYFMHAGLNRNFAEDYIPTLIYNDKDFLSTRLSYKLNLKGPSITVQTACSTSLVAVHLARQSLLSEEIDLALAGAISVRVPHRAGYFADAGGVTSPDGHVRAFDAGANGTVFGSGGGVIVLKRLRDALAAGDTIRAVIKGSAINNDGAEKAGYTAPSVNSQADAVVEALANADANADSISYIEAHGSGTPVGDPIEVRALTKAFRASTQRSGFCAIGSVKTNVGHLDAAAGMAGLIKTVLALQHRKIPASLHFSQPNAEIDFPSTPFYVNTRLTLWPADNGPRRAGIMSTGMGGTNAHIVLEEAPPVTPAPESSRPVLLVLSAHTESALATSADQLREFFEANPALCLDDATFTLQTGRRAMPHRRFVVAADRAGAMAALSAKPARFSTARLDAGAHRPVILLLPGVGDHYVGMGRELYATFPVFRQEVDRCAEILRPHLGLDIRDLLYPKHHDCTTTSRGIDLKKMLAGNTQPAEDDDSRRLNEAVHLQPALFTIEYALAKLWSDLGVISQAIVGHSMGEYVAACIAGVFSLEDALRLIVRRTQLVAPLPPARMLAVPLPESELQPLLASSLSIALINGPKLCVVAGPPPAVEELAQMLTTRGVLSRSVQNTHAFHSRLLDSIVPAFATEVRKVRLHAPTIPFISNVTGQWITTAEATDPDYWARHTNHTARFHDAFETLWQTENPVLLEAGPGRTLGVLAQQHPSRPTDASFTTVASMRHHYEGKSDEEYLLTGLGQLWLSGAEIRWESLHSGNSRRRIPLPTYPFERQNYWINPEKPAAHHASSSKVVAPLLPDIDQWFYVPSWERTVFPGTFRHPADATSLVWLVISRRLQDAAGMRKCLEATGAVVQLAHLGKRFERLGDRSFEINSASPEDYLRLFREIKSQSAQAIHVVHLGCVDEEDNQTCGFFSLLAIAQTISALNISIPVTIGVLTNQIYDVTGSESLNPRMATALGACAVIPNELSNVTCFNVDLPDARVLQNLPDEILRKIQEEFNNPICGEVIAFRGAHRWRKKYDRVPLRDRPISARLRQRGVYLITGGTGGIGLAIAKYLAKTCQARLVLTKKSVFPEKSNWNGLAKEDGTPDSSVTIIRQLLELESMGAEVNVFVAEVSDRDQMQRVFAETLRRYNAIDGIIHAAGIIQDGLIEGKTVEVAQAVMAPKVEGCDVLYQLSKDARAEFLTLFSSTASVLGPRGQIDYSAANAYLDAFSHFAHRENDGPHTLTINWPGWREVGILAELVPAPGMEQWKAEALNKAISTDDGLEAFRRALDSDLPQVIVSPQDLNALLYKSPATFPNASGVSPATNSGSRVAEPPLLPEDELEKVVATIWSEVLGVTGIAPDESFFVVGGHSLLAMQVVTRLRTQYGVDITLRDFFEAPTISRLSTLIRDKIVQDIDSLTDDEVRELVSNETQAHD